MRKRKIKRYNGEEQSYVEDYESLGKRAPKTSGDEYDEIGAISRGLKGVEAGKYGIASKAKQEAPETVVAEEKKISPRSFKEAFAEARRRGDKTFMYKGELIATKLAKPKDPIKQVKVESAEEVTDTSSKPAKTAKEKMAEIVSRTPLRNPQGGINVENMLRRNQEIGATGMKESARQARVDRIRKNVGSNLETYGMKKGGQVTSASKRADGIAQRGKTRGRIC